MDLCIQPLWVNTKECNCWVVYGKIIHFSKKLPNSLPKWLYHFVVPPATNESCCGSAPSPAFAIISILDFGHCNKFIVISTFCFNLQFPYDIWCGASFHMVICHRYIFFGGGLFWSLAALLKSGGLFSDCWVFKSFLYILGKSDVSFANISSHCVIFLLILLTVSFIEPKLLILMKSSLSIISFIVCKKSSPCPRSSRFSPVIF